MKTVAEPDVADAVGAVKFFRALKASRLMPCEDVEALERRAEGEPLAALQEELLNESLLTEYQMSRIRAGRSDGLVLGKYHILNELGEGGFGKVFKAYHSLMHRTVALKMLGEHTVDEEGCRDIFVREVIGTTRLSHPNIAAAYDADECDGEMFFVMEYVDGPTLEGYVAKHGPVSTGLASAVLLQAAKALQHAHQLGFVHRDMKPANMILSGILPDCPTDPANLVVVKVLDFGLARFQHSELNILGTLHCQTGGILGTPAYMAPEQVTDPHSVDCRSDLYSLGCTLYFALTGKLPFAGSTVAEIVRMHLCEPPASVRLSRPSVPQALAEVVLRLMAKNPDDRFRTPTELIDAVGRMSHSLLADTPGPLPPPVDPPITVRSNDWYALEMPDAVTPLSDDLAPIRLVECVSPSEIRPVVETPTASRPLDEFRPQWARWFQVVERLARREAAGVTPVEYKNLYREIRGAVAPGTPVANSPPNLVERGVSVIEPWVSLSTLSDLDAKMLASLYTTAQRVDTAISPTAAGSSSPAWLVWMIGALVAGGAGWGLLRVL